MKTPEKQTLAEVINNSSRLYPDKTALSFTEGRSYTFKEVSDLALDISSVLYLRGVNKGDKIAIISQNMPEWGIAYLAITSMGAVAVPILTDFNEREIFRILEHSGTCAVFISSKLAPKFKDSLPDSIHSVFLTDDFSLVDKICLEQTGEISVIQHIKELKNGDPEKSRQLTDAPGEEDLAAILYTSGTTGNPKGVMLTHKNLVSNAINTGHIQEVTDNDRLLSVLPLAHTYECTIGFIIPIMNGATVYYLDKPPTASVLIPAMQKVRPTMMLTVPLIIEKIYKLQVLARINGSPVTRSLFRIPFFRRQLHKLAGRKLYRTFGGELHFFGIGGAKLAADAERFLRDAGFPYAIGYGLTETSPLLAGSAPSLTRYQSTGFCLPGQILKIDNPDPVTGEGEILAKGPNIMKGYYKDEAETRKVFTDDGWFKTGDLGIMDKNNYLYIKGRLKNMVLGPSGENIYPEDIESLINNQSMVLESVVLENKGKLVALVHLNYEELEKYCHELKATAKNVQIQMSELVTEKLNEIKAKVNKEVNKFSKLSRIVEQQAPFEKTPTQKIKRFLYQKQEELSRG